MSVFTSGVCVWPLTLMIPDHFCRCGSRANTETRAGVSFMYDKESSFLTLFSNHCTIHLLHRSPENLAWLLLHITYLHNVFAVAPISGVLGNCGLPDIAYWCQYNIMHINWCGVTKCFLYSWTWVSPSVGVTRSVGERCSALKPTGYVFLGGCG